MTIPTGLEIMEEPDFFEFPQAVCTFLLSCVKEILEI
jgi:hypothetical protein